MAEKSFAAALNEQIANEFAASQQYIGAAVYYDAETLPRLAHFFYRQALEEREHAMIMIRYLLDTDEEVHIPDIKAQETSYSDGVAPVRMALEQEKRVSDEIFSLFELARDNKDYRAEPGTLVECHVPHCDTCIAVHDVLLGYRGDTIETVFQLEARGAW